LSISAIKAGQKKCLLWSATGFGGILMPQGFQSQKIALPIIMGAATAKLMTSLYANGGSVGIRGKLDNTSQT
jgi:hypothetical protein